MGLFSFIVNEQVFTWGQLFFKLQVPTLFRAVAVLAIPPPFLVGPTRPRSAIDLSSLWVLKIGLTLH